MLSGTYIINKGYGVVKKGLVYNIMLVFIPTQTLRKEIIHTMYVSYIIIIG